MQPEYETQAVKEMLTLMETGKGGMTDSPPELLSGIGEASCICEMWKGQKVYVDQQVQKWETVMANLMRAYQQAKEAKGRDSVQEEEADA